MSSARLPRSQLLAAFALAGAAVWGVIGMMLYHAHRAALEPADAARRNLARSLAEHQADYMRDVERTLRQLRSDWQRDPEAFAAAVERHRPYLQGQRVIQVAVLDAEGWPAYTLVPPSTPANFSDRGYFRAQKASAADQLVISEPVFGRVTRQWAVQFSLPLRDPRGGFAGVIVVAVPPPALEQALREFQLGEGGVITLVRSDGAILARNADFDKRVRVSLGASPTLQPDAAPAGELRLRSRIDGTERFYSYRRVQDYPVTVFVGQSVETVMAPFAKQRNYLVAGGLLASLLLSAFARLLFVRWSERAQAERTRARLEAEVLESERRFHLERERMMLALHDGCIQSIYAIGLNLENGRRQIAQSPDKAARLIADAEANLNLVIQDLRAFISGEPPQPCSAEGFVGELRRMVPAPGERVPQLAFDIDPEAVRGLSAEQAMHALKIAGEGISNVVRHAAAKAGRVALSLHGATLRLEISDDGIGMAAEGPPAGRGGLGMHHINARAAKLGGRASLSSAPGRGTRILVEFPRAAELARDAGSSVAGA